MVIYRVKLDQEKPLSWCTMFKVSNGDPTVMEIEWLPHNKCNFKCSYCHSDLNNGSSSFPNLDKALNFFNFLDKEINPNKKLLSISRGEPILWPRLSNFINLLNNSYKVSIVTNGSRTIKWWAKFISETEKLLDITISVHFEFANLKHIHQVVDLVSKVHNITVLILYNPSHRDLIRNFVTDLVSKNYKINILINPIRDISGKSVDYNESDKDFIKNFYYNNLEIQHEPFWDIYIDDEKQNNNYVKYLVANKLTKFNGWHCNIGKNRLCIWHDGNIYPGNCSTAKKYCLGNINDEKIKIIDGVICENNYCGCLPDIKVPKWKIDV
jgi:MoaA/NifB/PqqE/SkfB family radical SAM enzyme